MKFKLKDINFENLQLVSKKLDLCKITNVRYQNESIEFQTPKVIINENETENFISLKIMGNESCKKFFCKIQELQSNIVKKLDGPVNTIFTDDSFVVKVKKQKPRVCDSNGDLFNYYHLKQGMEIICLVSFETVWTNQNNENTFNLNVKEIMLLKK
jgi:hypothetical protein